MKKKLHPGARWLFRFRVYGIMIVLLFFLVFIFISSIFPALSNSRYSFSLLLQILFLTAAGLIILVLIIAEIYARMAYNRWFYEIGSENARLERGIIWKRYSNIPYERVQNIDINRGIIARIFGFSSLQIQTAGYSMPMRGYGMSAEGYIPAINVNEAEQIREFVLKKIKGRRQGL
jgi:uncharacterized membrane protein YdbT with pleckstrin-like domain